VYDSCPHWYAHTYEQVLQLSVGLGSDTPKGSE